MPPGHVRGGGGGGDVRETRLCRVGRSHPGEARCLEGSALLRHGVQDAAQSECPITVRHG